MIPSELRGWVETRAATERSAARRRVAAPRPASHANACALPGSTLKIDSFLPVLRRAVLRGFVRPEHAQFVEDGLLHGFDNGVDDSRLTGRRIFENYPSATSPEARDALASSVISRIQRHKTVDLGLWDDVKGQLSGFLGDSFCIGVIEDPNE